MGHRWGLPGSGEGTGAVSHLAQAGTCHSFRSTSGPPRRGFFPLLYKLLAVSPPFPFLLGCVSPPFASLAHTHLLAQGDTGAGRTGICSVSLVPRHRNWLQGHLLSAEPWRTDRIYQRKRWGDTGGHGCSRDSPLKAVEDKREAVLASGELAVAAESIGGALMDSVSPCTRCQVLCWAPGGTQP